MNTTKVGNLILGDGIPKICVSLVSSTQEELEVEASAIKQLPVDIVEWRADKFEGVEQLSRVCETLASLKSILKDIPLLFTFRTINEGGDRPLDIDKYENLNKSVAWTNLVDAIDVEAFIGEATAASIIEDAHKSGVKVICSNHDFNKTPAKEEIITRLVKMQAMKADVTKIAVMPKASADVATLLEASIQMKEQYADRPFVTISMGKEGYISRFWGHLSGSAMTFGVGKTASAPGQPKAADLKLVLDLFK
ncbi:MAG: type I 3-dehydroquinate dehydratase [Aminipila sp.]